MLPIHEEMMTLIPECFKHLTTLLGAAKLGIVFSMVCGQQSQNSPNHASFLLLGMLYDTRKLLQKYSCSHHHYPEESVPARYWSDVLVAMRDHKFEHRNYVPHASPLGWQDRERFHSQSPHTLASGRVLCSCSNLRGPCKFLVLSFCSFYPYKPLSWPIWLVLPLLWWPITKISCPVPF